jgi:hypothetical protein
MNLIPILVTTKALIGTLFKSDLARIMAFLSDDWGRRFLEWTQIKGIFSENKFLPSCPKSREDVWALSGLHLDNCNLGGESILFSYFPKKPCIIYTYTLVNQFIISLFWSWLGIGRIPPEIVKLTNLRDLRLNCNKLKGLYFHNFTQTIWRRIFMSNKTMVNQFCVDFLIGPIPPQIVKLTNLQVLSFQINQLTGR